MSASSVIASSEISTGRRPAEDIRAVRAASAAQRRNRHRRTTDRLLEMARLLGPADRAMMTNLLEGTMTPAEFAAVAGEPSYRVRRRFAQILKRLNDTRVRFIAAHLELWPERRREIATRIHIRGETQTKVANALHLSRYAVRREVEAIRVLIDQARTMRRL